MQTSSSNAPVPNVLIALCKAGVCRVASSVPDLSPYEEREGVPAAVLPSLQLPFARVPAAAAQSQRLTAPFVTRCLLPEAGGEHGTAKECALALTLTITQAPAVFAMPVLAKRKFQTPFVLTLAAECTAPLRFTAGVKAHSVDEGTAAALATWSPPLAAAEQLAGGEAVQELTLSSAGAGAGGEAGAKVYRDSRDYAFPSLAFTSPSSMRPRWLLFTAFVPGGAVLSAHFLLPTIVMSRASEQEDKAARALWGGAPPERGFSGWTLKDFARYIKKELCTGPELQREPTHADVVALSIKAGFLPASPASSTASGASTATVSGGAGAGAGGGRVAHKKAGPAEFRAFQLYLEATKRLLHVVRLHYERESPAVICGFAVGRNEAERALHRQPPGTFLLRFSSEGDALALSSAAPGGGVEHLRLGLEQLEAVALEEALLGSLAGRAQHLLDLASRTRHPAAVIMQRSYLHDESIAALARQRRLVASAAAGAAEGGEGVAVGQPRLGFAVGVPGPNAGLGPGGPAGMPPAWAAAPPDAAPGMDALYAANNNWPAYPAAAFDPSLPLPFALAGAGAPQLDDAGLGWPHDLSPADGSGV